MTSSKQRVLMCAPDYFCVSYVINPWMEGHLSDTNSALAKRQWQNLCNAITRLADVVLQPPQPGLPDLVFTANAGLVLDNKAVVSRFRNKERQGEEPHDLQWFRENGFEIIDWPQNVAFEGAGDALFDRGQSLLWVGQGFRSDVVAPATLAQLLNYRTETLHLVDPRFYHLDTCLCPLTGGYLMYFPGAFDVTSRRLIEKLVPQDKRIAVSEEDAVQFCCNAVDLDRHVFMNGASTDLQDELRRAGFTPAIVPLSEFMKAGGAAKCLTLKLVEAPTNFIT